MSETRWQGRFLQIEVENRWEWAARVGDMPGAVILAIDDEDHVILIEQYRHPLGRWCLEVPAGLVGDEEAGESVEVAAIRELEEETGYRATRIERLGEFHSSPGLTSERFTILRAHGVTRVGDGGGTAAEEIVVRRVAMTELPAFVHARRAAGVAVDAKLLLLLGPALLMR